jgi:hypothetical protein
MCRSGAFIICPLPKFDFSSEPLTTTEVPKFVTISLASNNRYDTNSFSSANNILRIHYPPSKLTPSTTTFAACVQPTYKYDNILQFLEWMELHKALGVSSFTFYHISIGSRVECILNEYNNLEGSSSIQVLPWADPSRNIRSGTTIKEQNQLAALNDCIYRYRGLADYVINVDLDEFIIPHEEDVDSYASLIRNLDSISGKTDIGAYLFRNAFFSPQYANKESTKDAVQSNLATIEFNMRQEKPHPYGTRHELYILPNHFS